MNILLYILFIPAILWIGVSSTLSDIKTGKVKNRLIIYGLSYGVIVYILLFLWTVARKYSVFLAIHAGETHYLSYHFYLDVAINVILALTAGILLWKFNVWAAGDAKLFTLFCLLVPLTVYSGEKIVYFPSLMILLNSYTIAFFYLVFTGIYKLVFQNKSLLKFFHSGKKKSLSSLKKIKKKFTIVKLFYVFNIILILTIAFSLVSLIKFKISILGFTLSSQILTFLVLYLGLRPVRMLLMKKEKINLFIFLFLIILSYFLWKSPSLKFNPFIRILQFTSGFFIFLYILRRLARYISKAGGIKKINLKNLKPGMILTKETTILLKKNKKFFETQLGPLYFDGLSLEQTEKIKKFLQNEKIKKIDICQTFPFAPFVFAGTLATLILRGSVFNYLMKLFN
ncbi:MAG: hypothetical protein KKH98_13550 [Spirochaetes bacterium]|nr:hypothetical protein [Spirochaetota bacterium]